MPDMGRNEALAGKTVYAGGMNITYDGSGYAVKAYNPHHPNYAGTSKSLAAQPIEDALAGKPWEEPSREGLTEWGDGADMPRAES